MGRPPCCDKEGIKKGPWTPEEDIILVSYIQQHGPGNWRSVPTNTGLLRCSKSCRLRWTNYLRPGIKRGNFTPHEEGMIIHLQALLGNKWAAIASYLPQRTDNDIKNYWNTHLKKKLKKFQSAFQQVPQNFATAATTSPTKNKSTISNDHHSHDRAHPSQPSPLTPCYASSTENISRLLENWMKSSSMSNTNTEGDQKHSVAGSDVHDQKEVSISHDQEEEDEFETILSFHNLNNGMMSSVATATCEAMEDEINEGEKVHTVDNLGGDDDDDENNPPFSTFLDKWFLDETTSSRHAAEEILQLPSFF